MDLAFILISVVILLPFIVIALVIKIRRQTAKQKDLMHLMTRAGLNHPEQETLESLLFKQKDRFWFIWLVSLFKKAGMSHKKEIVLIIASQGLLLFVSTIVLLTQFNALSERLVLLLVLLPLMPAMFLFFKIHQRQTQMRQQFPDMLEAIVRSIQSGYGIDGALAAVGNDMKGVLAQEMKEVNKQLILGISIREVLREFQSRVDLSEAQFFVVTLIIQRETGGQLAPILTELAKLMRRRVSFQSKIKTLTAESRFTAWFIGGAPVAYLGYKYFFDKESMQFFLHDPVGIQMLVISIVLIAVGTLLLKQMLKMRF